MSDNDLIRRRDAYAAVDAYVPSPSWRDMAHDAIAALPAVDVAGVRADALREAAARAQNRWAIRKEHADRLYELDYPEAKIDSKTVSAKADEAEMIAAEILALIDTPAVDAPAPDNVARLRTPDPRVEALVKAADRMLDAFCVHDTGEQVAAYEATCDALAAFRETTK